MSGKQVGGYTAPKIIASSLPFSDIKDLDVGMVKVTAGLGVTQQKSTSKQHLTLYETTATDKTGSVRVIWFNLRSALYLDTTKEYVLMGKLNDSRGNKTLIDPVISLLEDYKKWEKKLGDS